ncbi:MAG: barstar family protein [Nitrospirae bacterium]|nr:barstar family protein [Nitrospirota bacterium]MBU6482133.1 barstar family protein [Nitrospirota bacterium]MDE3042488.1 barstar family protein [Nitrospirota bacterium]MDE3219477.1 barstar family protein [Nitrospirota bacterium]
MVKTGQRAESLVHAPNGYALRTIKGAKCQTTDGLLTEFARALDFPDYFGHNWDALEECLADLEWLPAKGYILLITNAVQVLPDEEEYETFLEILRDAGEAWGIGQAGMGARRATPFHVLFAVSEREKAKRAHWRMTEINAEPTREAGLRRRTPSKRT